ncbi:MAG TPA: HAD family hydrolase [Thermomicrobiales bacterium]|nr:HAD family hydrolase [Thermomicrobiales bacterium]
MDTVPITVTFDFHDTLAQCDRWFQLEIRQLVPAFLDWHAARHGHPLPDEETKSEGRALYAGLRAEIKESGIEQDAVACLRSVLPGLGIAATDADLHDGVDELMRATFDNDVTPRDGAIEAVRYLADAGVTLGVVSSAVYTPFLDWTLTRFGIRELFSDVLTSAEAGFYKSDPSIYRLSAERLGTTPGQVLHVGDSHDFDVVSPRQLGVTTAWVRGTRMPPMEILADLILDDLVDAGPALLELACEAAARG